MSEPALLPIITKFKLNCQKASQTLTLGRWRLEDELSETKNRNLTKYEKLWLAACDIFRVDKCILILKNNKYSKSISQVNIMRGEADIPPPPGFFSI